MYDLIVRGGRVVDAANGVDGPADIAVRGDKIAAVGSDVRQPARQILDATGGYVFPGLVDLHVHVDAGRGEAGPAMLARAGVTTALDLAGPVEGVLTTARRSGVGIQLATVEALRPGHQLPDRPGTNEIRRAIRRVLAAGGIGIKLHVDAGWDADSTRRLIAEGAALGAWVAVHSGTKTAGSNLEGMRQTVALAGPHPVHIAHVNSYCRGELADPLDEACQAVDLLRSAPRHFAESYLAEINGNSAVCVDGVPRPRVAGWLAAAGYPGTEDGLRRAIEDGWASIPRPGGEDVALVTGTEGVALWREADTRTALCLPVNPVMSRVLLATSRDRDGHFDVHALATDGGAIPRNVTIRAGLALVELGALTPLELVRKASWTPARMLGLPGKGHLGVGADADLTIVDIRDRGVRTTVSGGAVVAHHGVIVRTGTRLLTTEQGRAATESAGLRLDVHNGQFGLRAGDGLAA